MSDLLRTRETVSKDPYFKNLREVPGLLFDLKYASSDNFMGRDVYGPFTEPFLQHEAAAMLERASEILRHEQRGHALLIFDALRPRSVQRILFDHVKGTEQESYVADPDRGSMHNYGCAVDLTVVNEKGRELDMGTAFDAFTPVSEPKREDQFLADGKLTLMQVENRLILRRAMTGAGFFQLPHEWWHYDAFPGDRVRREFRIVE